MRRLQSTLLENILTFIILFLGIVFSTNAQKPSRYKPVLVSGIPVLMDSTEYQNRNIIAPSEPVHKASVQRTENLCGVTASFTPGIDSFFSTPTGIVFTSTSINAISLQWQVNGLNYTQGPSLNFFFNVAGSYEISLIASSGNCTDVFSVTIVYSGTPPAGNQFFSGPVGFNNNNETGVAIANTADSGFIIGGSTTVNGGPFFYPSSLLIKMKTGGCIEWTKQIKHQTEFAHNVSQLLGLRDSGYLVSGHVGQLNYLMRMDKSGGQRWVKQYNTISTIYGGYKQLYEMSDGSIVGATSPFDNVLNIGKMDASGQPIWTKHLQKEIFISSFITTTAIFEWKMALYILGSLKLPDVFPNTGPFTSFLLKLNPSDGTVIWTKLFESPDPSRSIYSKDIQVHGDQLLISSLHFNTLGGFTVRPLLHWIDSSGVILAAKSITQTLQLDFPTGVKAGVLPGNNIMLYFRGKETIGLQPGFFLHAYYMKLGSDTNIIVNRQTGGGTSLNSNYDLYTAMNFNGRAISNIGTAISAPLVPWLSHSQNMWFQYRDSSMLDYGCSYNNTAFAINNISLQSIPFAWLKDSLFAATSTPVALLLSDVYPQIKSSCPDYIDSCAILKVKGQKSICNLNDVYTYKAGKNNKCPRPVEWTYQGSLTVVNQTDSSISVRFNSFGNHTLIAKLRNSCNPVLDSINIVAGNSTPVLNLGNDRSLCGGNSITLHASPHYLLYSWMDGSTDSLLTVNAPGLYWVEVTDSCGNLLRDSVTITLAPPVPLYAGPDRTKCNNDTLRLNGPAGFLNYTWTNNYNIISPNGQTVIVNPLVDTAYYLKAELTAGCFGFDTVRIKVHHSPPIQLGSDTSFCSGDSVRFDAGAAFAQYTWSNGMSSSYIIVKNPGTYSVIATTADGCKSYDTSKVINVWALPNVQISGKSVICIGKSVVLDAGISSAVRSYKWNDGSTTQTINVISPGSYNVAITDNKGCIGKDTLVVTHISPLPANFLFPDTAVCSYEKIELKPAQVFTSYLWNTNATGFSITASAPNQYWLKVKDQNDCEGVDTILVNIKECIVGIYFPTAFTPNNDGKNDLLKPVIFGPVKQYKFSVYNRWGELVFHTSNPILGWDGKRFGQLQDSNSFVWVCSYQLEVGTVQLKKGTALLIR